jgi:hypothetical protein
LDVVREVRVEVAHDPGLHRVVEDREHELDSAEEVAIHPVRARAVDLLRAAVVEVEATAVLEEPADDRAHANVVRHAGHARAQAADAADDQIDVDARARRP